MFDWIQYNKDWFLSGAGIFIVSSLIAVASSLLTLYTKFRSDRKSIKILSVHTKLNKYKIEDSLQKGELAVSYKGKLYDNLCQYLVIVENTGQVAIEGQKLLLKFPPECVKIDFSIKRSSQIIQLEQETYPTEDVQEELHSFQRLEPSDKITISYMLNTTDSENIDIQPRGVDGVRYNLKGYEGISELQNLIVFFAIFLVLGIIPFIGELLQALVVLIASKTIIHVLNELYDKDRKKKSVEINSIKMTDTSVLSIRQE